MPIRANIVGPPCSATSNSAFIAGCHSGASCSALGSLVMYSAASLNVSSARPFVSGSDRQSVRTRCKGLPLLAGPRFARTGTGIIWIDHALAAAARCRHIALCQRGIGALDIIPLIAVGLQADRIGWVIHLGASRRRCRSRRDCQNCQSQNAHQGFPLLSAPLPSCGQASGRYRHLPRPFFPMEIRADIRAPLAAGLAGEAWFNV
jgi:hypothetical protein